MNPAPSTSRPTMPPTRLVDTRLPRPGYVPAVISRGHTASVTFLSALEQAWGADRALLDAELLANGESLEHTHWRWTNKAARPPDWHTLFTIEAGGEIQGIMAVENALRPSRLIPQAWVLYLDYIEIAPWNIRVPQNRSRSVVREPRYRGVGAALLGEAIRLSIGVTAGGRLGLHSLPQAEDFYAHCGMMRIGSDPNYHGLAYFEYPDGVAATALTTMRLSI